MSWIIRYNAIRTCPVGVIGLIMLFVRVPPEDTVGVIGLIMIFVRPTKEIGLIMLFVRVPPEDTVGVIGLNEAS